MPDMPLRPLVSIAIVANDPTWLGECLDSAIAQDYPALEIVVLAHDNGVVASLCSERTNIRMAPDGTADPLSTLIAETHGRYIKFVRDCDRLAPDCVSRLVEAIEQAPEALLAFSLAMQIDNHGKMHGVEQKIQYGAAMQLLDGNALRRTFARQCKNLVGEPTVVLFDGPWLRRGGESAFRGRATEHRFSALAWVAAYCNAAEERPVAFVREVLSSCRTRDGHTPSNTAATAALIDWRQIIDEIGHSDPPFADDRIQAINTYNNLVADFARMHPDETADALALRFEDDANPHYRDFLTCRTLIESGRTATAQSKLLALVEQKTSCWQVYETLADIALARHEDKLALAYLETAAQKNCTVGPITLKLAMLLIGTYRLGEGHALLETYLARHPDDSTAQQLLASIETTPGARSEQRFDATILAAYACLEGDYEQWQARADRPCLPATMRQRFEFVILARNGNGNAAELANTIDAVAAQSGHWHLTILADFDPPDPALREIDVLTWLTLPDAEAIAMMLPQAIGASCADWLVISEAGTVFAPDYLGHLAAYLDRNPQVALVYTDDDHLAPAGKRCLPRFKPDFDPDYFCAFDYVRDVAARRDALMEIAQTAPETHAETYDIVLGILDRFCEKAIGHLDRVLVHIPLAMSLRTDDTAARSALARHFARRNEQANIEDGPFPPLRRIRREFSTTPKVSIIIPTRNRIDLLRPCIDSLFANTRYSDYELIVVDNGSDDPEVARYYARVRTEQRQRVKFIDWPGEFNYAAMNNAAGAIAAGDYLLLLNNDTECIHDDWLDAMMAHAQRPDVGIVGARLLFPDSLKIQHAGVVLGMTGTAGHPFLNSLAHDEPGYLNRAQVDQEFSAVTGACLLIRKSVYDEVGGLDEQAFRISFNDIDLCLRVRQRGYRIIWTPFATLLHHGSATQIGDAQNPQKIAAFQQECNEFYLRWTKEIANDPAWNRNLSLCSTTPAVEDELVVPWNTDFHDRPRILVMPVSSPGAAEYRNLGPLRALHAAGRVHYASVCQPRADFERAPMPVELARLAPDVLVMHAPVDNVRGQALLRYVRYNPEVLRIYALDDLITHIPESNPTYRALPADAITERLELGLKASNRLIVSTEPLMHACRHLIDDIRLLPNSLPWATWGQLQSQRRRGRKLRVGWAGAQQHAGDLRFMLEVVTATSKDVDWVFFGMLPDGARAHVAEFHDYMHEFSAYPAKLASLDLDLAVAPLEIHPFNEAKSNLRLLEYGILGWPVICTDILPYQTDNPPVTRLPNDPKRWIAAIRERVAEPDAMAAEGDLLREWVKKHYLLEQRLDQWFDAYLPESSNHI
jgi:GT2 family glycosyltransferase